MIEYTLEWLAMSKVEEVFVFCCAHAEQITDYLSQSKWAHNKEMVVTPVVSTSCFSAGEALRLIDQKDIIKNDFVLINGDTVCNINLAPIVEAHRARRQADKSNILTMITKSVHQPLQRLRLGERENVICLDPKNNRLLKFHEAQQGEHEGEGSEKLPPLFKFDAAFFGERDSVQVRTDLKDTQISICAPEVLMLFSDNFDYQSLKPDFITGVLSEEELGNKLYIAELGRQEYAAHVSNLRAYDAISRDIIQRWAFPLAPDTNLLWRGGAWGPTTYRYARGNRYYEQAVTIPRTAHMEEDVVVGAGTSIGENSRITQSVIGRNCRIGKNVDILGSYVLENASIQDGAVLRYALVCDSAVVGPSAVVSAGAVISHKAVIAAGHHVPPHTRVSLCSQVQQEVSLSDDELEYSGAVTAGRAAVGKTKGKKAKQVQQQQQQQQKQQQQKQQSRREGGDSSSEESSSGGGSGSDSDGDSDRAGPLSSSGSEADVLILCSGPSAQAATAAEALAMGHMPDEATLAAAHFDEAAVGKGEQDCADLPGDDEDAEAGAAEMAAAAGAKAAESDSEEEGEEEVTDPESNFKREVSETFLRCVKLRFDQTNAVIELNGLKVELLLTFEEYCSLEGVFEAQGENGKAFAEIFEPMLKIIYDAEIVSEEAILAWADEKQLAEEEEKVFVKKAERFLQWLREPEESSSGEEEDSD
ncbi:hypothetical protein DUNSADRAFT_16852 [Dunaliella salina]|uniref:Translation initiation factor eIF2B subunit epsilon n=1 Tax=Dunaliella salina TaxID=3046 RepID=A0ABQ7G2R3_DUNSA|nr:hypothetical protein DUNSADRAFT_16852 [Dunaliella salina]|eukprot:KAF5828895.1 hypothetical protein DUNSADRAFT_16852 [Dunaliella salina]